MGGIFTSVHDFLALWSPYMGLPALLVSSLALYLTAYNEGRRLGRKNEAERAALPLVLSEIHQYAVEAKAKVDPLFRRLEGNILNKDGVEFKTPALPDSLSTRLKGVIEASNSRSVRSRLADTVTTLQIVTARLDGLEQDLHRASPMILRMNLQEMILDIAALQAIVSTLYRYSRRQSGTPERYGYEALRSALRQLYFFDEADATQGLDGQNVHEMMATLDRRENDWISPFIFDSKIASLMPKLKSSVFKSITWRSGK